MNEVLDRIEDVVVGAARRRARARHRRVVLAAAVAGVLLLASAASAVTGVGPVGEALTRDEVLPEGAEPASSGESVTLAGETSDGRRQEVRVYRRKPRTKGRFRDRAGAHHYCAASYSADARGKVDPISIICTLGTSLALKLEKRTMWLGCSGRGGVIGEPAPPDPVCGLVLASTRRIAMEADRGEVGPVKLSRPFALRVNRSAAIVRREGIDPQAAARLPRVLRVRAVLGVVDAPATLPGRHKPRVRVTAVRAGGGRVLAHVGGSRLLTLADLPSGDPTPQPGGPRSRLTSTGPGGRRWTLTAWRTGTPDHCVRSTPRFGGSPPNPSMFCVWRAALGNYRSLVREGSQAMATRVHPPDGGGSYAVYGIVRADAARVTVRDPSGRAWAADVSSPWTVIRRRPGDLLPIPKRFRDRFRGLPGSLRVRTFQAVLAAPPGPGAAGRIRVLTSMPDGRTLQARPLPTQSSRTSPFGPPPGTDP